MTPAKKFNMLEEKNKKETEITLTCILNNIETITNIYNGDTFFSVSELKNYAHTLYDNCSVLEHLLKEKETLSFLSRESEDK